MISGTDKFLLIDKYLQGLMSEQERLLFEKELEKNIELRKKVELTKLTYEIILRNKLSHIRTLARNTIETGNAAKIRTKRRWLISAVLLGLIGIFTAIIFINKPSAQINAGSNKDIQDGKRALVNDSTLNADAGELMPDKQVANNVQNQISKQNITTKQTGANPVIQELHTHSMRTELLLPKPNLVDSVIGRNHDLLKIDDKDKAIDKSCSGIIISAEITTTKTCINEAAGNISVTDITGGNFPYNTVVTDSYYQIFPLHGLAKGVYSVRISDAQSCFTVFPRIEIQEVNCQKDYEINPDLGGIWEYGIATTNGRLSIYDSGEQLFYSQNFKAGESIHWNGHSENGLIKYGYFIFAIEYTDSTTKRGSITIAK